MDKLNKNSNLYKISKIDNLKKKEIDELFQKLTPYILHYKIVMN